jgi:hypothetical protein
MKPVYIIRSAKPGDPSILWLGKSGRKYRSIVDAVADKAEYEYIVPVEPVDTEDPKTASYTIMAILAMVLIIFIYKFLK